MGFDSISAVNPAASPIQAPPSFTPSGAVEKLAASLTPTARAKLIDLDAKARLWVLDGNKLRRTGIVESLERWASGRAVAIVTQAQQVQSQSSSTSSMSQYDYNLFDSNHLDSVASNGAATTDVNFTYELVQNPKLLPFVRDGVGVEGAGEIPAQGGTVRTSTTYRWFNMERRSHAYWLESVGSSSSESSGGRVTT